MTAKGRILIALCLLGALAIVPACQPRASEPAEPSETTEPSELTEPSEPTDPSEPAEPSKPAEPADGNTTAGYGTPADLQIELYAPEHYKIDEPYYLVVILRNATRQPIICEETFDFASGINAKKPPPEFKREPREVAKRDKPLVIEPGAFVGKRLDLAALFPALRMPGRYEIYWQDPTVGKSETIAIEIVEYVLLVTDYGNITMRLLPGVAPKTVAEFKRRVRRKYYDGGFVEDFKPDNLVIFHPRVNLPPLERLPLEKKSGQDLVAGSVAVLRDVDRESLDTGRQERPEFLAAGGPSFFIQIAPVAGKGGEPYTTFATVIDGWDVLYAISNARRRKNALGSSLHGPDTNIFIERAVVVDSPPDFVTRKRTESARDGEPDVSFRLHPPLPVYPYGLPIRLELKIFNDTDTPLAVPGNLALTSGLRVERVAAENNGGASPEGGGKTLLEPVRGAPGYALPQASARMEPGDIFGISVDITDLYREFADGGHFSIRWESGNLNAPPLPLNILKTMFAVIDTNRGEMQITLFREEAPQNVARFVELARSGFYDGKPFHHAIETGGVSLVQTGSSTGTGTGRLEKTVPLEASRRELEPGSVVMARTSDPDSASSQFFIIKKITEPFAENWQGKYTIIGRVISERPSSPGNGERPQKKKPDGMDVLQSIQKNDTVNKITIYDKPLLRE